MYATLLVHMLLVTIRWYTHTSLERWSIASDAASDVYVPHNTCTHVARDNQKWMPTPRSSDGLLPDMQHQMCTYVGPQRAESAVNQMVHDVYDLTR